MRIYYQFTPLLKILLWVMFALSTIVVILSLLIVCGIALPLEISPAQAILLLFSTSIVAVFSVTLATIHYQVTETHLRLNIAFFDILGGRIRLEKILNIVYKDKKMYISYIWQGADPIIAQISIAPKNFEKLKSMLMSKNAQIVFWDDDKADEQA